VILDDITQAVGGTPLLRLTRFAPDAPAEILAKLELLNPYSIKDRPVLAMIEAAERQAPAWRSPWCAPRAATAACW
jgi:cysteine synthase A